MSIRAELEARVGQVIGVGDWHTITQADIDRFAGATRDPQWIHVDAARAAEGPFGATIAHGFMTLALTPGIGPVLDLPGLEMIINYGLNRVRFLSPVPVGSRVRVVREIAGVSEKPNGILLEEKVTIELEGSARPACVAETLVLLVV
ncbi:MAG: MaoC family dehydratase [bacterium]|nr:MaoC family dehydratase [bacterium]MDE0352191.1 MaoC family dehydratase [bacterium]